MEGNPTIKFKLLGDARPPGRTPSNVGFHTVSLRQVADESRGVLEFRRPRASLASPVAPQRSLISNLCLHTCSQSSPRAAAFGVGCRRTSCLATCAPIWTMQLSRRTISYRLCCLRLPCRAVYGLSQRTAHQCSVQKSAGWRSAVRASEYVAFDEWWNPQLDSRRTHMAAVVEREAAAGHIRAFTSRPHLDTRVWMQDDYVYIQSPHCHSPTIPPGDYRTAALVSKRTHGKRSDGMTRRFS